MSPQSGHQAGRLLGREAGLFELVSCTVSTTEDKYKLRDPRHRQLVEMNR